eukprot:13093515-Alexandrium_andersonii.AAC.1
MGLQTAAKSWTKARSRAMRYLNRLCACASKESTGLRTASGRPLRGGPRRSGRGGAAAEDA